MQNPVLKKLFNWVFRCSALFLFISFNFAFLVPRPALAQSITPCDCITSAYWCDPGLGGAFSSQPLGECSDTPGVRGDKVCLTLCGGKRIDPADPAGGITGGGANCTRTPTCTASCACTQCYGINVSDEDSLNQIKSFCESGAFCGEFHPLLMGKIYRGEPGLYSTFFKQCFCGFGDFIQTIVDIGYTVVGALSLAMFALGAIKYMTSRNDPEKIADAKSTLLSAVAGLVLVLLSIAILRLLDVQLSPWGIQFLVY